MIYVGFVPAVMHDVQCNIGGVAIRRSKNSNKISFREILSEYKIRVPSHIILCTVIAYFFVPLPVSLLACFTAIKSLLAPSTFQQSQLRSFDNFSSSTVLCLHLNFLAKRIVALLFFDDLAAGEIGIEFPSIVEPRIKDGFFLIACKHGESF